MERVTVAVTNFNGREHLPFCLEAIRKLDYPAVDVMLIDNASTDGSVDFVRRAYPQVRVVPLGKNRGPAPARNLALRRATTDLVLAIDNDAVLTPASLGTLVSAMREDPAVVACQPRVVYDSDPDRIHYDGGRVHYLGMSTLRNFRRPVAQCEASPHASDILIAVAILFDRSKMGEEDLFDEDFFIFFEDQDLAHRLRLMGRKILTVSRAVVRHREGTAGVSYRPGGSLTERRAYYFTRNRWFLIAKNYSVRSILLLGPPLVLYELTWMLYLTVKGRFGAWRRGICDLLRARRILSIKRRRVQASRRVRDRELLAADPLTFAVPDTERPLQAAVVSALNLLFRTYWTLVRSLV